MDKEELEGIMENEEYIAEAEYKKERLYKVLGGIMYTLSGYFDFVKLGRGTSLFEASLYKITVVKNVKNKPITSIFNITESEMIHSTIDGEIMGRTMIERFKKSATD